MRMLTVKLLLIPTKEQRQKFHDFSYYSDRIYNEALQWKIDYYEIEGKFYSRFDLIRMLPEFKNNNPEFKLADSFALASSVTDLRIALNNMKQGFGFPRFKRYGRKLSFGVRGDRLKVFENSVQVPSVGLVKYKHCHWLTKI